MPRARTSRQALAGLAALAVTGGALVAGTAAASSQHSTQSVPMPQPPKIGRALIQGVVADQFGRYVDDAEVHAVDAEGQPVSAYVTYASDWEDGPQHGYFYLWVRAGSYEVTFEKDGYLPTTIEVDRAPRQKEGIGEVTLRKVIRTTTVADAPRKVRVGDRVPVDVEVSPAKVRPTGKVTVSERSRTLATVRLDASDRGRLTLRLPALSRGVHTLVVEFDGGPSYLRGSSDKVTVEVVKRKHR